MKLKIKLAAYLARVTDEGQALELENPWAERSSANDNTQNANER
jgi:hypothetical protein